MLQLKLSLVIREQQDNSFCSTVVMIGINTFLIMTTVGFIDHETKDLTLYIHQLTPNGVHPHSLGEPGKEFF